MATNNPIAVVDELIELRGLRFHYRDWAPRRQGAPTLILLHGFTGHARSWDPLAAAMTDGYRVLAFDQRGHGESGWAPKDAYSIENMADDLIAFVQALEVKDVTLLGLSMGGLVTIEYASRSATPPAACIIVDIGPEIERTGSSRIQSNVQACDVFDSREGAFASARADNSRPPEALHRLRSDESLMRTGDGRYTYRYDRALRSSRALKFRDPDTVWTCCKRMACPTLIVRGGESDILAPAIADRMVQAIPDARLITIPGASHAVPFDAPEAFEAAIRGFSVDL